MKYDVTKLDLLQKNTQPKFRILNKAEIICCKAKHATPLNVLKERLLSCICSSNLMEEYFWFLVAADMVTNAVLLIYGYWG